MLHSSFSTSTSSIVAMEHQGVACRIKGVPYRVSGNRMSSLEVFILRLGPQGYMAGPNAFDYAQVAKMIH